MTMNNENKKLSRNIKRRIERKIEKYDRIKSELNKIKSEKKNKNKSISKMEELEIELIKTKYVNSPAKLKC